MSAPLHVFGVRHHGPGSARSLRRSLEALRPDCVLVEGPPDAHSVLPLLAHKEMKPPVALLVYASDEPARAVYYPFAVFSPEWQAVEYALKKKVPVRFMDLPQAHRMALDKVGEQNDAVPAAVAAAEPAAVAPQNAAAPTNDQAQEHELRRDPLGAIAEAAGYDDGERWWEHMVETRTDDPGLFAAVLEMMGALRETSPRREDPDDLLREAYMRRTIRSAQSEGFERIAVVCGAWHAPVLADMPDAADDDAKLKGLPSLNVTATWVPWTYDRLAFSSGYGAGVASPGWYHHLWECAAGPTSLSPVPRREGRGEGPPNLKSQISNLKSESRPSPRPSPLGTGERGQDARPSARFNDASHHATIKWMTRVAHLLRAEDLDASPASVIEAVRLAESLAALRACPLPGLPELNESCTTVFCFGNDAPLRLIHRKLIVGEALGRVPDETPTVPLQADVQREQKRLRLPPESEQKALDLDLRKPNDLDRSRLLHRLELLGVPWGSPAAGRGYGAGAAKGTFHEIWQVQWQPEFAVKLIEAAVWGNTLFAAAAALARDRTDNAPDLPALTNLLDKVVLADLPAAVEHLMARLQSQAALASDVAHLMGALPALANVLRYGNVRQTDTAMIGHVVDGLVARICIGLPPATASLNDDAAAEMFERLLATNDAISLLQNAEHLKSWHDTLRQLADRHGLHGLLAGRAVRLLLDAGKLDADEAARRMGLALSVANEPARSAAWVEGLLKGSGLLLLHGDAMWNVVDAWLAALPGETFTQVLPLLRRTFATFEPPERRQMGERAKQGPARAAANVGAPSAGDFDVARAESVLPLISKILGLEVR